MGVSSCRRDIAFLLSLSANSNKVGMNSNTQSCCQRRISAAAPRDQHHCRGLQQRGPDEVDSNPILPRGQIAPVLANPGDTSGEVSRCYLAQGRSLRYWTLVAPGY